jgi:predicted DNA-binding transcriptional regulator AlpA
MPQTKENDDTNENDASFLLTECQASKYLGYTPRTLQAWRMSGKGPRFVRVSERSIRYRKQDILDWVESRIVSSTSETLQNRKGQ